MAGKITVDVGPAGKNSGFCYKIVVRDDDTVFTGKANTKWGIQKKIRKGKKVIKTLQTVNFKDD